MVRLKPVSIQLTILLIILLALPVNRSSIAQTYHDQATNTQEPRQRYIVQLQGQALVPFAHTLAQANPKNPKLNLQQTAVNQQRNTLKRNRQQALRSIQATLGRSMPIIAEFETNLHAIALELNHIEARRIQKLSNVLAVYPEQIHKVDTDYGAHWIGADKIHTGAITGMPNGYQGEGIVVGIIDTGINMLHPSFAELGEDGYQHINPYGQGNYLGACNPSNPYYQASIVCNNKLIGAWTFPDTAGVTNIATQAPSPHDDDGHGSHTASTVAGNVITQVPYGDIYYGPASGVAPHANIIAYDVCGFIKDFMYSPDCPSITILQAIEQATIDQVDVINFSISGGVEPWYDPIEQAFLAARQAGIIVVTSAGNNGPSTSSVNHVSPWLLSVAASTHDRQIQKRLTNLHSNSQNYPEIIGLGNSAALTSDTQIIYAGNLSPSNPTCNPFNTAQAQQIAGKIVLCNYSSTLQSRTTKAKSVLNAGGAGIILANLSIPEDALGSENYPLPAIEISQDDGDWLRDLLTTQGEPLLATISATERISQPANADIVADFSSRGPAAHPYADLIKPDLAAPGVAILAAIADNGDTTADFDFYDGTSMASPHVAGSAALLAGLHPDWTASEIQSALMLTAHASLKNEVGNPTTVFDHGSGRVRVDAAAQAGLVLDESVEHFQQANPATGGQPSSLNLANMAQTQCLIQCSWSRTFRNTQTSPVTWSISTSNPDLQATPSSFTIAAGGYQTIQFTLNVAGQNFGSYLHRQVVLQANMPDLPDLRMNVAAIPVGSSMEKAHIYQHNAPTFSIEHSVQTIASNNLGISIAGMSKGTSTSGQVKQGMYKRISVQVPANADRLVADLRSTSSPDLDVYIMFDANNNTIFDAADYYVCASASPDSAEYCSIDAPLAGRYFIDVENFEANSSAGDPYVLVWAAYNNSDSGLQINWHTQNPNGSIIRLEERLDLSSVLGDSWYGSYRLYDLAQNRELGRTTLDFHHTLESVARMDVYAGDLQSAMIHSNFTINASVRLTNSTGAPVVGQIVHFSGPSSGAGVIFPNGNSAVSNSNGIASVAIRANAIAGSYQILASSANNTQVTFNLSNITVQPSVTPMQLPTHTAVPTQLPTHTPVPTPSPVSSYSIFLPKVIK